MKNGVFLFHNWYFWSIFDLFQIGYFREDLLFTPKQCVVFWTGNLHLYVCVVCDSDHTDSHNCESWFTA